jgi:tetratricopeptide (TPR) repeat protein
MPVSTLPIRVLNANSRYALLLFFALASCSPSVNTEDQVIALTLMETGRAAADQQRYADALTSFQKASNLNPHLFTAHYERGNIYARLGQMKTAVQAYEQALALEPNHAESRHNLAVLRADQGRLPDAITLLENLRDYAPALETLSLFYAKQGQYQEAEQAIKRGITKAPNNPSLQRNLGSLYMRQGRYREAEETLYQAWRLDSTHVETARLLGQLHQQTRRSEQAIVYFRQVIAAQPAHIEAHYNMATALSALGRRDEAQGYMQRFEELGQRAARIAQLRRSLDEAPNDVAIRIELAHHYAELEQAARAMAHYRAILLIDSLHITSLVRLSNLLLQNGEWSESLALCQRGIAHYSTGKQLADLHFNAGYIQLTQKNYDAAEAHLTRTLAINPDRAEAWNNLGNLMQRRDDLPAAQRSFLRATQADPHLADAHFNLAVTYQQQELWLQAQHAYRTALEVDPSFTRAYFGLAGAYEATDSTSAARRAYQQFIAQWQGDAHWRNVAQQHLAQLREAP